MSAFDLEGEYIVRGNCLERVDGGKTLLVAHRGDPTPSKPLRFIVDKTEPGGKYVSSLYEEYAEPQFESRGVRYAIQSAGDRVRIRALQPRTPKWPR